MDLVGVLTYNPDKDGLDVGELCGEAPTGIKGDDRQESDPGPGRGLRRVHAQVHSAVRPWSGTFADVELTARKLAAGLRARGVNAGDAIAFQLPNWMEAAAVFWASAMLGTVTVPAPPATPRASSTATRPWDSRSGS